MTRILLVEDDPAIARNLVLLLHSEGFTVTQAPTRKEAAVALDGHTFDMALIDISLPDGNGFTVYTEIKATREVPVIFLTASGDEASVVNGLNVDTASGVVTRHGKEVYLIALGCSDAAE